MLSEDVKSRRHGIHRDEWVKRGKQGVANANASSADPTRLAASELLKDALSTLYSRLFINLSHESLREDHRSSTEWVVGLRVASAPSLARQPLITPNVLSDLVQLITPEKAA